MRKILIIFALLAALMVGGCQTTPDTGDFPPFEYEQ